jgi:hypothetical protein
MKLAKAIFEKQGKSSSSCTFNSKFIIFCYSLSFFELHLPQRYRMFILSLSDSRQQGLTKYLGPLKKLLPKILTQVCLPETAKNCAAYTAN